MKKTIYSTILLFFILMNNVKAQDYLSFYNLGDYVIQTQNISPIYLPKYKVNFGSPPANPTEAIEAPYFI